MTRLLQAQVASVNDRTDRNAKLACTLAGALKRTGVTPTLLDEVQTALRADMLWAERRLSRLRRRQAKRAHRIRERVRREPTLAKLARAHRKALKDLESALRLYRAVLRQIADSYAWLVLGEDPRVILPLYAPQTHQLPERLGLAAPAELAHRLHAAGTLLAVENDLTRCLGVGDLTVVFAVRPWRNPLALEVKASGVWKEGTVAEIGVITAHSDASEDTALYEEVSRIVGDGVEPERVHKLERQDQIERLLSHTKALASVAGASGPRLPGPSRRIWRALETVVLRAFRDGGCYDLTNADVAFLAVKVDDGARERLLQLVEGLQFMGFGRECGVTTLADFHQEDEWSAVVPPIPLWPVSRQARVALMTGGAYFAAMLKPDLWKKAMQGEGLTLEEDGRGGWLVVGPSGKVHLDLVEVQKLSLGVAFTGISPRDVARRLAQYFASKGGEGK